jgi:hypothetical protein
MRKTFFITMFLCVNLGVLLFAVGLPENCIQDGTVQYCKNEVVTSNYCTFFDAENECFETSGYLRGCDPGDFNCTPQECNISVGCLQIL